MVGGRPQQPWSFSLSRRSCFSSFGWPSPGAGGPSSSWPSFWVCLPISSSTVSSRAVHNAPGLAEVRSSTGSVEPRADRSGSREVGCFLTAARVWRIRPRPKPPRRKGRPKSCLRATFCSEPCRKAGHFAGTALAGLVGVDPHSQHASAHPVGLDIGRCPRVLHRSAGGDPARSHRRQTGRAR
jgi:hypothetical protein